MDARFDRIDLEFGNVREEMHGIQVHLEARIREEGEATRRHFNIMVEKVEAAVRIVTAGHTHVRPAVDDHETRLQAIETAHEPRGLTRSVHNPESGRTPGGYARRYGPFRLAVVSPEPSTWSSIRAMPR